MLCMLLKKKANLLVHLEKYTKMNFTEYSSLSFFSKMVPNIPYSTLKSIAQKSRFSKKYNLKITYV